MSNYDTFNTRNYECSNCNSLSYRTLDSGFHGSYGGKEDYSGETSEGFGY